MYYTYILKSSKTGKLYIGQTNNLKKRLFRHNNNLNPSTKGKGPWDLIYSKTFETRSEAIIHELKLKKMKNTHFILSNLDKL